MMGENGQGTHRRFYHDYRGKDVYHITLLKREGVPAFGAFAAGWREIFDEADALGGRFIKLTTEPIHPRDNAHGADFERCAQGRLLRFTPPR